MVEAKPTMSDVRVAFVTNVIPPYRRPLFEELGKHIDLTVVCSTASKGDRDWIDWEDGYANSFKTVVLKGVSVRARSDFTFIQPSLFLVLRKIRPDVIITSAFGPNTLFGSLFARMTGIPVILWSASSIASERKYGRFRCWYRKFLIKLQKAYVAVGMDAKDYLVSIGAPEDKCFIAVNAVDDVTAHPEIKALRKEGEKIRSKYKGSILLYSGRLIEIKGIDLLFNAYKTIQDTNEVTLLILGSGPLDNTLKNFVVNMKLKNVEFLGFKQEREMWAHYFASDVYVLPTREDTWGMVINEAMQCGLPVVCSKYAGCSRELVVHNKTGFIIDPYDTNAFAEALERTISDSNLRKSMSNSALEKISEYSMQASAKGFLRAIKSSLE